MSSENLPRLGMGRRVLALMIGVPACLALGVGLGAVICWLVGGDPRIGAIVGGFGGIVAAPVGVALLGEILRAGPASVDPIPAAPAPVEAPPLPAGLRWLRYRLAFLLLVPMALAGWEWGVWGALCVAGDSIQAEVAGLGGGAGWRTYATVTYTFTPRKADPSTNSQEISDEYKQALRLGGPVPVLYLASHSQFSRIADDSTYRFLVLRWAIVGPVIYVGILLWLRRAFRRNAASR